MRLYWGYIGVIVGSYSGYIGVILELYWVILGLYWDNENKVENTILRFRGLGAIYLG